MFETLYMDNVKTFKYTNLTVLASNTKQIDLQRFHLNKYLILILLYFNAIRRFRLNENITCL